MKKKVQSITPRCGICKKLYSSKDDDGSGLCLQYKMCWVVKAFSKSG